MSHITINLLPEGAGELPICFHTASCSFPQRTMRYPEGTQDFHQILLVLSGTGVLHSGGKSFPLERGCAFFTAMGYPSEYVDTGDLTTAFLTARGTALPQLLSHYSCGDFLFAERIDVDGCLSRIQAIIREYYERKREGYLSALTYSFFVDFFEDHSNTSLSPLEQTSLYIERNFTKKLTLTELAAKNGSSVSKLCHDFKKTFGCTVFDYILQLRLTYARSYLQNSREARTKDAAISCGFEDVSYFCKAYKKRFGCSPARDRRDIAGLERTPETQETEAQKN